MDEARAKQLVNALVVGSAALSEIAATASRNKKSLTSPGHYSEKFHNEVVKLTLVEKSVASLLQSIDGFDPAELLRSLAVAKSTSATPRERDAARKQIRLISESELIPNLGRLSGPQNPATEPILPSAVLDKAPSYLRRTLLQANGCYEARWFDACSVMIRKLVENLIIDVYEKHGHEGEIKKDGDYLMLAGLISAILQQSHWQLQRGTKRELPEIKKLGDRAAHNRRYQATRQDIDAIRSGLRATIDDLLHLAGHK